MKKIIGYGATLCCLTFPWGVQSAHEAHVHGIAQMNLVVEGQIVEIELETPLANVLSFEHAPESDAQKKEVRQMASTMRKAEGLFVFSTEAKCRLEKVSLDSNVIDEHLLNVKASGKSAKAHGHHQKNIDGDAHKDDHEHEKEHGGHGDLDVDITFKCQHPEKLSRIEVNLFNAFPDLQAVQVQMVTSKGQNAAELSKASREIRW